MAKHYQGHGYPIGKRERKLRPRKRFDPLYIGRHRLVCCWKAVYPNEFTQSGYFRVNLHGGAYQ